MKTILSNLSPGHTTEKAAPGMRMKMRTLHFPTGLGLIAEVLKVNGYSFSVYDSYVDGSLPGFYDMVEREKPDIILFSGFLGNYYYPFITKVSAHIREICPSALTILGGPITASIPGLLARHTDIDFIVVGEGERTIVELLEAIDRREAMSRVKGVFLGKRHGNTYNGDRERLKSLELWPRYEEFPVEKYRDYLISKKRGWELSTSRGCYNMCAFCKLTFGRKISNYSLDSILSHVHHVTDTYGVTRFSFVDDNFLNSSTRVEEFLAVLDREQHTISWRFQGRADSLSTGQVEKMIELGCYDISFGLESGSQQMLDRYRKKLDIRKATEILMEIRKLLNFHATFIVGGPGEDMDTIKETEILIRKLELRNASFGIMTLFPGTILYEEYRKKGLIPDEHEYCMKLGPVYEKPYTNISNLTDAELLEARDHLEKVAAEFGDFQ